MVTIITVNNQEFVVKPENISKLFKAMNKEQLDALFKNIASEKYPQSVLSLVLGTETYIGSLMKGFEKLAQQGLIDYKKMHQCDRCKTTFAAGEHNEIHTRRGKEIFCDDCLRDYAEICPTCGHNRLKTEVIQIVNDNKTVSTCCFAGTRQMEHLIRCVNCHKLYVNEHSYWSFSNSDTLCPICRDHFETCGDCGRAMPKGTLVNGICTRCVKARKVRDAIKSYGYKPDPKFISAKNENAPLEYMGLEWEMELIPDGTFKRRKHKAVEDEEWINESRHRFFAQELNELSEDWGYCKSDGSLDYGVEFVTHPITLKAWVQDYYPKLCAIKEAMKAWGCRTKASTAGIHIHYSRSKLDTATIRRICWLLSQDKVYEFMRKFCHRNTENMTHWAKKHSNWNTRLDNFIPDTGSRYKIVNLCNSNTIEFRCFGYTVNVDEIMAYLYAVDSIVNYCRDHKNQDVEKANIIEVLTYRNTEKMVEYLEKRSDLDKCV